MVNEDVAGETDSVIVQVVLVVKAAADLQIGMTAGEKNIGEFKASGFVAVVVVNEEGGAAFQFIKGAVP